MKTHKITRLLGIGLTLMLLVSILAIASPVTAKDPGDQQWANGSEPGMAGIVVYDGSDVTDFAVGSDGVCYLADGVKDKLKRSSSGTAWASLGNYNAATRLNPTLVAVAPDNSDCIAVVDTADSIHISNDAGVTWSTLPALTGIYAPALIDIKDIAVGPARSGTLLGREYVIAVADIISPWTVGGDVLIIGETATWTPVVTAGVTGTADFVSVEFSPNYAGDRVLMAVGGNAAGAALYLMNVSTGAQLTNSPVVVQAAILDYSAAGNATCIKVADIAVASDFDPTDANAYRAWVSVTSDTPVAADDGVYRVDGPTPTNLNIVGATTAQGIDSIAYSGTNDAGTLFGGYISAATAVVKRTANPQSNTPTWTTTKNNPTGSTFCRVAVAPDFGSTNRVIVGTTGAESAWNLSDDGGVSFYQKSYIDNGAASNVVAIDNMAVTADGSEMWWVTDDYEPGPQLGDPAAPGLTGDIHVWKSSMPPTAMSFSRMFTVLNVGGNASRIRLNPDWAASPSVFVIDDSPATNDLIYVSHNAGATWTTMQGPGAATMDTIAVADAMTLYATIGTNFYKSTNAGWTWEPAVAWYSSGTAQNIAITDSGKIFIGRTGGIVRMSSDGGATWASQGTTGYPSNAVYAMPHEDYDTEGASGEGILFSQDLTTGIVYRYDKNDGSGLWYALGNTGAGAYAGLGIAMQNGILYSLSTGNATPFDCERNMYGTAGVSTIAATWESMTMPTAVAGNNAAGGEIQGAGGASAFAITEGSNVLWISTAGSMVNSQTANTTSPGIWGYKDHMASAKPVITSPPEGYTLGVDPVNGRANVLTVSWDPIGTGTAVVNEWDLQITEKAIGWGAPFVSLNGGTTLVLTSSSSPSTTFGLVGASNAIALNANTEYMVRVRCDDQVSNDAIRSGWSDPVNFSVGAGAPVQQAYAGPQILGPAGGSTTTLTPGFSWAPVSGATEYEFILATDSGLSQTLAGTPAALTAPAFQSADALDYATTYFWAVRVTKPTAGPQTIGTFTTMAKPVEPAPPVVIEPAAPAPVPEPAPPAIPAAAVWAVIGIGAILVIAVLVLIVRTRRPL